MVTRRSEENEAPMRRRASDQWHVGKEIPIALIIAVGIQTMGFTWWMAQLSSKVDTAVVNIGELKTERYTREDARRDGLLLDQRFQSFTNADRELERRINSTESRIDRLERK